MTTTAERSRRARARKREGKVWVSFEAWPSLIDALETAHGIEIENSQDAAAAIVQTLSLFDTNLDRLDPSATRCESASQDEG